MEKYRVIFFFQKGKENIMVKGYAKKILGAGEFRFFLYGSENLFWLKEDARKALAEDGISPIEKLKESVPEFLFCIADVRLLKEFSQNPLFKFQDFDDNRMLHISLEPWILENLTKISEEKRKTFQKRNLEGKRGAIQPNISNVVRELLLRALLMEDEK